MKKKLNPKHKTNARRFNMLLLLVLAPILLIASLLYIHNETYAISTEEITIETGFKSRFVLISDLHLGTNKNAEFLAQVVEKINRTADIDFVAVAGDWIDDDLKDNVSIQGLFAPLKEIKKPIIAVLGNHDFKLEKSSRYDELVSALESYNVQLIENKVALINDYAIYGVKDVWTYPTETLDPQISEANANLIVLTHDPDAVLNFKADVDLTLAGHTHCGQVKIPVLYKLFLPIKSKFEGGYYEAEQSKLFVSCGLGETGVPFRLWARPTVYVINTK